MGKPLPLSAGKNRALEIFLVLVSLAVGYLLVEASYRWVLYLRYVHHAVYPVTIIDVPQDPSGFGRPGSVRGWYVPSKSFTFTQYAPDGAMFDQHRVQINNLGWVSAYDYDRHKAPGEYRIAVVGDSLTASINNTKPWPDILQSRLNEDRPLLSRLGARKISVLNLGVAGASMEMMANPLAVIARRFSPDMVIVNFIAEDLSRRHSDDFERIPAEPAIPPSDISEAAVAQVPPHLEISGIEIPLDCRSGPPLPANPDCKVSTMWYSPSSEVLDREALNKIKRRAAWRLLRDRVILSPRPLAILELLGRPVIPRAGASEPAPLAAFDRERQDRDIGIRALKVIRSISRNMLVLHNPLYWHLKGHAYSTDQKLSPILDPFVADAKRAGIEIVRMEQYMPVNKGEGEWRRWYNHLPYDGHWSDYGAEIYAGAVEQVIRSRLPERR
ncbi:MAG TPA: SGNH/GDSL hydrolase family protein [Burkholderiales bacterium]|nr:SGNH/GDSL hydrolase family protein [Burkholderiales bacterium]